MKKMPFITIGIAVAIFSWLIISGFSGHSSVEDVLRNKIAELEKQLAAYEEDAGACTYKYFDTETDLGNFITKNYNESFMYNTVAVNTNNLKAVLNNFPANSNVYLSIVQTPKGKDIRINIEGKNL